MVCFPIERLCQLHSLVINGSNDDLLPPPASARPSVLVLLLFVVGFAACDSASPEVSNFQDAPELLSRTGPEYEALDELTWAFAVALDNAGLRNKIHRDLRDSRFTVEHKLHFWDYIETPQGGGPGGINQGGADLLVALSNVTERSIEEVVGLAEQVGPLEFYLPVDAHREQWQGGRDMIVASAFDDDDTPTAYDLDGEPVALSVDGVPETITLSLVPVETDFSAPLDEGEFHNGDDQEGKAIGTYARIGDFADTGEMEMFVPPAPCDPVTGENCDDGGGGTGGGGGPVPGLYYEAASLNGVGESWFKGDPEIEVHVIEGFDPEHLNDYWPGAEYSSRCQSGQYTFIDSPRRFDQNDEQWSGSALVLSESQLSDFEAGPEDVVRGFTVHLFEDDDTQCELVTDLDIGGHIGYVGGAGFLVAFAVASPTLGGAIFLAVSATWSFYLGVSGLIRTDDDYLGMAVPRENFSNPGYEGYTHIMVGEDDWYNGAIKLVQRQ